MGQNLAQDMVYQPGLGIAPGTLNTIFYAGHVNAAHTLWASSQRIPVENSTGFSVM